MKVKELIEQLQNLDPEMDVILQIDPEGNGYRTVQGADGDAVVVKNGYHYEEVYDTKWSAGEACMEEDEWEEFKRDNPKVCIIYP